jgi:hypothetical protein
VRRTLSDPFFDLAVWIWAFAVWVRGHDPISERELEEAAGA